jgi:predicted Zn-dependent protease
MKKPDMKWKSLTLPITVIFFLFLSCSDNSITDSGNNGDPAFSYNHQDGPGESAVDFLTDQDFGNLVIEIDYMEGYKPTEEALNGLKSFLGERLHKSNIKIMSPSSIPADGQSSYTASDVRNLEEDYRSEYSEENTLAAYVIILDGEYSQSNVLGIAYYNTSTALFGESIESASSGVESNPRSIIEATILQHEFGHLLGLVDNGVEMQEDHKDRDHGEHCTNEDCLMYYSVRTTDFFSVLLGGEVPDLDAQCRADLAGAGGK